jgi:hypothetical protein
MSIICVNKQFYGKVFKLSTLVEQKDFLIKIIQKLNQEGFVSEASYDIQPFNYTLALDDNGNYISSPGINAYEVHGKRTDGIHFYCFLVNREISEGNENDWILDIKYNSIENNFEECEYIRTKIIDELTSNL